MKVPHYVVDAFTRVRFRGNAAAVCVLEGYPADDESGLGDDTLRAIAAENNLSETAFLVKEGDAWRIRWFTPTVEVDLCGHATLASAWVVLERLEPAARRVTFLSRSGPLVVERGGPGEPGLAMDFPARPPKAVSIDPKLAAALGGVHIVEQHAYRDDVVAVLDSAAAVEGLTPDFAALRAYSARALTVTAAGGGRNGDVDFVSRFFAPGEGIDEDPVTGSAHCTLGPLWAARVGKPALKARQVSRRRGDLVVEVRGERVIVRGDAVLVVEGTMEI